MLQQLLFYLMSVHIPSIYATCSVTRVIMRVPRENEIGLIFDLTVTNSKKVKSEMLTFSVNSNGVCSLNLTDGEQIKAGTIFGGEFGNIEPGASVTVSLVWPTVSVYNRVGSCPIVVSSMNHRRDVVKTKQILYFDTRFETLDPGNHSLRRQKNFRDCKNWDLNYLRNCTPLNCEERYFGKRSFYNRTTQHCEEVPPCFGEGIIYDYYANECMDMNNFITDEEIEQIKQGKFDNNILHLQPNVRRGTGQAKKKSASKVKKEPDKKHPREAKKDCNFSKKLSLVEFNNCFQHLQDEEVETPNETKEQTTTDKRPKNRSAPTSILKNFYYDWYMPLKHNRGVEKQNNSGSLDENSDDNKKSSEPTESDSDNPKAQSGSSAFLQKLAAYSTLEWLFMSVNMLLIVLVVIVLQILLTLFTYFVVCSTLYLALELVADLTPTLTGSHLSKKLTPRHRQERHAVMTSASLMSQLK